MSSSLRRSKILQLTPKHHPKAREHGFLIMSAVIILIFFSLLGSAMMAYFMSFSAASIHLQAVANAEALAESALEQAQANFSNTDYANRSTCANLSISNGLNTGSAMTTTAALNNSANPTAQFTYLSSAIAPATPMSTINVTSTQGFAPMGWLKIGHEVFQYLGTTPSSFTGVQRAQDGSLSAYQPSSALVSQYQCIAAGTGETPASNPVAKRTYWRSYRQNILFSCGQSGNIYRWNGAEAELTWAADTTQSTAQFNAISALNYHEAWAVADHSGNDFIMARLDGDNPWISISLSSLGTGTNLLGINAPSVMEAWAVGIHQSSDNTTILRWTRNDQNDSSNWCNVSSSSSCGITQTNEDSVDTNLKDLYAIKTIDYTADGYADMGFAVGGGNHTAMIWIYSGSGWRVASTTLNTTIPNNAGVLLGLDITANGLSSPQEFFFVGQDSSGTQGVLLRLLISGMQITWSSASYSVPLNAVSVVDTNGDGLADFGMAVGSNGAVLAFNMNNDTSFNLVPYNPSLGAAMNLTGVVVINPLDVWIQGNNAGSATSIHYNGSTFSNFSLPNSTDSVFGLSGVYGKENERPSPSWSNSFGITGTYSTTTMKNAWYDQSNTAVH